MQTIVVKQGQSVLDIAIVYTGDVKTSFDIAVLNGIAITDDLPAGKNLIVPDVINKNIVALFNERNQPATDLRNKKVFGGEAETQFTGIEYWAIEKNFKVG